MNGAELVVETRALLRDRATPYLWKDDEILRYLNEAEREFARLTHCLHDYNFYSIETVIGLTYYELDNKILSVLQAQVEGEECPMTRVTTLMRYHSTTATGTPRRFATSPSKPTYLSVYPAPDAAYIINLLTAILPSTDIDADNTPSVDEEYHLRLAVGAAAKCLSHSDTDGFAPELLTLYTNQWAIALRDGKRDSYRRALAPNNHVAVSARGTP